MFARSTLREHIPFYHACVFGWPTARRALVFFFFKFDLIGVPLPAPAHPVVAVLEAPLLSTNVVFAQPASVTVGWRTNPQFSGYPLRTCLFYFWNFISNVAGSFTGHRNVAPVRVTSPLCCVGVHTSFDGTASPVGLATLRD